MQPLLVDCLNCELGCNGGTGTGLSKAHADELEYPIRKRRNDAIKKYSKGRSGKNLAKKVNKVLSKFWKEGLYDRTYLDLSKSYSLLTPNNSELEAIYRKMPVPSDF